MVKQSNTDLNSIYQPSTSSYHGRVYQDVLRCALVIFTIATVGFIMAKQLFSNNRAFCNCLISLI